MCRHLLQIVEKKRQGWTLDFVGHVFVCNLGYFFKKEPKFGCRKKEEEEEKKGCTLLQEDRNQVLFSRKFNKQPITTTLKKYRKTKTSISWWCVATSRRCDMWRCQNCYSPHHLNLWHQFDCREECVYSHSMTCWNKALSDWAQVLQFSLRKNGERCAHGGFFREIVPCILLPQATPWAGEEGHWLWKKTKTNKINQSRLPQKDGTITGTPHTPPPGKKKTNKKTVHSVTLRPGTQNIITSIVISVWWSQSPSQTGVGVIQDGGDRWKGCWNVDKTGENKRH